MNLWIQFWGIWLILSGAAFAGITVIVAWKGFADLRAMFRDLGAEKGAVENGREGRSR
jgi:hypothetical protein